MAQLRLRLLHNLRLAGCAALLAVSAACGGGSDSQSPVLPPTVAISPASVTTTVGAEFTFSAIVERATDPTIIWKANQGTITQDGAYTAPLTQGEDIITAELAADRSIYATAKVVVKPPPVISMAISPDSPRITVDTVLLFTARLTGGTGTEVITWSVELPEDAPEHGDAGDLDMGTISDDGLYTAPALLPIDPTSADPEERYGSFPFKIVATTVASGKQVTASTTVTVTTKPVPTVVIVDGSADATVPVVNGETRFFHAQMTDVSLVQVSWSVEAVDPPPNANTLPMPTVTPTGESTQFSGGERPGEYRLLAVVKDRASGDELARAQRRVDVLVVHVCVHAGSPPRDANGTLIACAGDSSSPTPAVTLSAMEESAFSATVTTNTGTTEATSDVPVAGQLSWTWSVQETTGGSIGPATGLYTAPARGGTYHVTATVDQYRGLRSASAAVLVNGVKVTINPSAPEVHAGSSVDLTATVTDVVSDYGTVTWLIQEGSTGGTLSPSDSTPTSPTSAVSTATYRAPAGGGGKTYRVIATSTVDTSVRAIATIRVLGVWTSVATGGHHTVAVKSDGTLWAWGNNYYGQLGDGTTIDRPEPVKIGDDTDWVSVSAGANHSLALKGTNPQGRSLYAWGANSHGQLGDNTFTDRNAPVQIRIATDNEWVAVSARGNHTAAIRYGGTLWSWGDNTFGQVGDGGGAVQPRPAQIVVMGTNGSPLTWAIVSAGTDHTLAIATDSAVPANRTLWAWGRNHAGQLGVNDTDDRLVPARVGSETDWLGVDGGGAHSVGIRRVGDNSTAGSVWAWGDNNEGQLGNNSGTPSLVPIQVGAETTWKRVFAGESHVLAVNANQSLWGWGRNARGELGIAQNLAGKEEAPVRVGNVSFQWAAADSGFAHSVMVTADGRLFVSGSNLYGEIGNGQVAKKLEPSLVTASVSSWVGASLAAGWNHSAAVDPVGRLWTWGSNAYGQLGDGTYVDRDVPVEIQAGSGLTWLKVSAGAGHTVAIRSDGRIFTWGDNSLGQLGRALGATGEQCPPLPSLCNAATPGEIPQFLGFDPWVSVTAGESHAVASTRNGSLWAWGNNDFGQVGSGTALAVEPLPVLIEEYTRPIGGQGTEWIAVAAAGDHTLAIRRVFSTSMATLWAWGRNDLGQVGDGTQVNRSRPLQIGTETNWSSVSAGLVHSFAVNSVGELWRWGSSLEGQLGIGAYGISLDPVRPDTAAWRSGHGGGSHSVGIMQDGTLWTWGRNDAGQLGNGTIIDRLVKVQIAPGTQWTTAAAGSQHTLAVRLLDGRLLAWGENDKGQLGDNTAWIESPLELK